jgi:hypothetical protein
MSEIVAALIEQSETKFDLLGFDERPEPRPPIDRELLNRLEAWWTARTAERVPPEYVQFLLVCDGIENFSVSYSLLGARDLLSDSYAVLLKDSLDEGVSFDYDPERPPILIGYDPETRTKAFFEFSHERVLITEPVFLEGNPGDMTLHPSFGAFLEVSIDANRHTIAELRRVREARDREGL